MFFIKVTNIIKTFLCLIFSCRIYIGRHPASVQAPAIILFPFLPAQFNCGFAGLMTCRLSGKDADTAADRTINGLWKEVQANGLQAVTQKGCVDGYLKGMDDLRAIETAVLELKREDAQEFLFFHAGRQADLINAAGEMRRFLADEEKLLENQTAVTDSADMEIINSRILLLKDICWMLEKDILANMQKVLLLTGVEKPTLMPPDAFRKYRKFNLLLNALDRLEVRGRDSAGIQLVFELKNEAQLQEVVRQIRENGLLEEYQQRAQKGDLQNYSIFVAEGQTGCPGGSSVAFTYKTFSIVGELGRNVAQLRKYIQNDLILQYFCSLEANCETALTHTRWASVGSITEENCHPVNNHTTASSTPVYPFYPGVQAQISAVLNGDIDNYPALRQELEKDGDLIAQQVTTDTKIIPLQIEKYLKAGQSLPEAFRLAVNDFEGSHAIAMTSALEPGKMFLALKGSGQSIYVGLSPDQYMFSSELYGLVEVMPRFIKMNGEAVNGNVAGQLFILDQNCGGGLAGLSACHYDGKKIELSESNLQTAEITTRDIDRGGYPHFFLKEISESALSVKRTLRGKYRITGSNNSAAHVDFNMGTDIVPDAVRKALVNGTLKNIVVVGHGTAAVAGQVVADALSYYLQSRQLNILARVASELSGFGLNAEGPDTLIIPITQSGTTTDTNRAVAMARERGAHIIAIVNRRQSDITAMAHGVFYTSDGRDIEMSVASTKAFYAQIVAGQVLALFFAQLLGTRSNNDIARQLRRLESIPVLMDQIFARRDDIAASVQKAADKRYWAIVGSGPNKAAADEVRIKLSELCYKTISSDIVENKKHIDLSSEPLILVCAAGNPATVVEDVVKDVAIFKAHKASVIVFADEGETRFQQIADAVILIPAAPAPLPVVLNTMAGHLWGYYAARAIDDEAQIFREFRNLLAMEFTKRTKTKLSIFDILDMIADVSFCRLINDFYILFKSRSQKGAFNILGGKTIADLLLLLKYAAGKLPLQDIRQEFNPEENLINPFDLLDATLGAAIDELTRPIDAIRHQAKTVTVGTSRKEKELKGIVFDLLQALKFSAKNLTYRNIMSVHRLQPAVAEVRGYSVYDVNGLDEQGNPTVDSTIAVKAKGGAAAQMKSRADHSTTLMGVKKTIVSTGHVYLGRGKTDNAPIMIIPLQGAGSQISNLLLIHIIFNENLNLPEKIEVLGNRYDDIRNLINEYNLVWNDEYLDDLPLEFLFSEPIEVIAGKIKQNHSQA